MLNSGNLAFNINVNFPDNIMLVRALCELRLAFIMSSLVVDTYLISLLAIEDLTGVLRITLTF